MALNYAVTFYVKHCAIVSPSGNLGARKRFQTESGSTHGPQRKTPCKMLPFAFVNFSFHTARIETLEANILQNNIGGTCTMDTLCACLTVDNSFNQ